MVNPEFITAIMETASSDCTDVSAQAYITLGAYFKNKIDITQYFIDCDRFKLLYEHIGTDSNIEKVSAMAWSLLTFTGEAYSPDQTDETVLESVS